jgi:anti-sigma regulatory factor (Ser/Thr protein kinase)
MGRVLVIQGAASLLDALRSTFAARGHEIEPCGGDVEAVRAARQRPVDVVVTDPVTSIGEDLALAQELQHARPGIRTIARVPAVDRDRVIEALRARVFACFTPPYSDLEIVDMVRSALADDGAREDIVVISGLPYWLTLRVSCRLLTADRLVRFLTEFEATLPEQDRDLLMAAFREMLLNAMEHGAGFNADKVVEVTAARTARAIVYHFRDPGGGFSASHAERAAATRDPEDIMTTALKRAELGLRPGGLGMLIVRQIADELVYNEKGNEVLLIKHIEPATPS